MSDGNLRDQFNILFDDIDDDAEAAAASVSEAVDAFENASNDAAETFENVTEAVSEAASEAAETVSEAGEFAPGGAAGLVDDTNIRHESMYQDINFEDLSAVIDGNGVDEPAVVSEAVRQATLTASEAHDEHDMTYSDHLEAADDAAESLEEGVSGTFDDIEDAFESFGDIEDLEDFDEDFDRLSATLDEEEIPAAVPAAAAVSDGLADDDFEDLMNDDASSPAEKAEDDDDSDDADDEYEDEDEEEYIAPARRNKRNAAPSEEDIKRERRNFWIFTAIVGLIVAAAVLYILWTRGIIGNKPTEAPQTNPPQTTEAPTTAPTTAEPTTEPTTEEPTTEPTTEEPTTEEPSTEPEAGPETVLDHYGNLFIVKGTEVNSLYVRNAPSPEGTIVGILYGFAGGEILGEEGDWYSISSGSMTGYAAKSYVFTGETAQTLAVEHAKLHAKVVSDTLNVRSAPDTADPNNIINVVMKGACLPYIEDAGDFIKITEPNGHEGYVSKDFVDLGYYLDEAVPFSAP